MKERIQDALLWLREDVADRRAPDIVETKLTAAFLKHHTVRRRRQVWIPATIAASLIVAFAAALSIRPFKQVQAPVISVVLMARLNTETPPSAVAVSSGVEVKSANAASAPRSRKKRRVTVKPVDEVQTSTQDFIEIPYAPPLADYEGGSVVRVNIPGASIRSLGLPVMSDHVQADVFFGDDGVARAIRVVSNSGLNYRR